MNYTELVGKAKQKDEGAIIELFERTSQKGYFVALKYLKNKEDAQDILQDSYVTALSKLDQLQDPARFDKWLHQIIANKSKNYLDKKKPFLFEHLESDEEGATRFEDTIQDNHLDFQPKENFDTKELQTDMKALIDELPDDQRICLLMYYFKELSINEISESLEVSTNTVKSRLHYARNKIKVKIEELQKKGTHLYSISPIPFMLWLLRDEAKATVVPKTMLSEVTLHVTKGVASNTVTQTAVNESIKKGILFKSNAITTKIVLAIALSASAIAGGVYLTRDKKDNQRVEKTSIPVDKALTSIKENDYDVVGELPDFEETPIDMYGKGYIVKVDGKYGFMDNEGNWLIPNEYKQTFFHGFVNEKEDSVCYIKEDTEEELGNGLNLSSVVGLSDISQCSNSGFGGYTSGIVTLYEDDTMNVFYYNRDTKEKIPFHSLHYTTSTDEGNYNNSNLLDMYGENSTNILIVNPLDKNDQPIYDKFYTVTTQGNVSGPFKKNEGFSFGSIKNSIAYENTPLKGLFLKKNEEGYSILSSYGSNGFEQSVKNAKLISYNAVRVKSGNYTGVIDDSFQVVLYGKFEDVSKPIDGKAFVKIDGKWNIISVH